MLRLPRVAMSSASMAALASRCPRLEELQARSLSIETRGVAAPLPALRKLDLDRDPDTRALGNREDEGQGDFRAREMHAAYEGRGGT